MVKLRRASSNYRSVEERDPHACDTTLKRNSGPSEECGQCVNISIPKRSKEVGGGK